MECEMKFKTIRLHKQTFKCEFRTAVMFHCITQKYLLKCIFNWSTLILLELRKNDYQERIEYTTKLYLSCVKFNWFFFILLLPNCTKRIDEMMENNCAFELNCIHRNLLWERRNQTKPNTWNRNKWNASKYIVYISHFSTICDRKIIIFVWTLTNPIATQTALFKQQYLDGLFVGFARELNAVVFRQFYACLSSETAPSNLPVASFYL